MTSQKRILPHIKDVIDKMEGAKFWSTLDAASAYLSMPLSETDKEKTAFLVSGKGKFEFNVTPYSLSNAGASYQRMIDICSAGLPPDRILAYIVIFSSSLNQHLQDLEAVFKCLRKSNISLKASKCVLASDKVDFLGYQLPSQGIKPQKRLTDAINQTPASQSRLITSQGSINTNGNTRSTYAVHFIRHCLHVPR